MGEEYDAAILGGGATGTAVFRDLALRGLRVALIEKNDIASGCSGHSHGNLVGGMRYVVRDPEAARECASENIIISRTGPHLINGNTNYLLGWDNEYAQKAIAAAREIGVKAEPVDISAAYSEIPALAPGFEVALQTEDKNIDAVGFCRANLLAGTREKGSYFPHISIDSIASEGEGFRVTGRDNLDLFSRFIVNATGAWANYILKMLDTSIDLCYNQGTIIVQESLSPRGLQLLEMPGNGQAYIVHNGRAWLGTSSTSLESPDKAAAEENIEEVLKSQLARLVPKVHEQKVLDVFFGVRPLYNQGKDARQISRDFHIEESPAGIYTIIGGKLTTARLMAEKVSDVICGKMGSKAECATHKEKLPEV